MKNTMKSGMNGHPVKLVDNGDGSYSVSTITQKSPSNVTFETNNVELLTSIKNVDTPTPYSTTTGTHPSVKYFPNRLFGYHYWMAFTPYPLTERENPCVIASQDGVTWVVPSGLTNPLEGPPETGYYNDTELVHDPNGKLYCFWRWHTATSQPNVLFRKESENGRDWGNLTECTLPNTVDPLSPSIIVEPDGTYSMFVGARENEKMRKLTSTNLSTWSSPVDCSTDIDTFGHHWHPMIWREAKYYYALSCYGPHAPYRPSSIVFDLYFGYSADGINWTFDSSPIIARGQDDLNKLRVYRSSAVRTGDHYTIFASGLGDESEKIKIVKAKIKNI